VRLPALLALAILLAGCGASGSSGSFGDATIALGGAPGVEDLGIYFAVARGYDSALGVELHAERSGPDPDFKVLSAAALRAASADYVAVMAIVQPSRLVLAVRRSVLAEDRGLVVATVGALQRGYVQAQLEPDEAVAAMAGLVPGLDVTAITAAQDDASASWTAGARFMGQLRPGPGTDTSIAR
jgi:ABC-type nitrate/sulfonate/bicarbonate transport system substrate-binding protein